MRSPKRNPDHHPVDLIANQSIRSRAMHGGYGFVSINRLGVICLNSLRVFFGDIDCIAARRGQKVVPREKAYELVRSATRQHNLCFRIYDTFAGVRLIELSRLWEPRSQATAHILKELQADEHYTRFVIKDDTFRARLSPKPKRSCKAMNFLMRDNDPVEYLKAPKWSIACYSETAGFVPEPLGQEIDFIVKYHDKTCMSVGSRHILA